MIRFGRAALLLWLFAFPALAATAPRVSVASYAELKAPLPYPYDERADAKAAVERALARARASGKRVLIDLGGNWCGDCRVLAATMALPEMKAFIGRHFEVVYVDVGRFDRNLEVPARFGVTGRLKGVPALLVVDPVSGRQLVGSQEVAALSNARQLNPQALADWISRWTR